MDKEELNEAINVHKGLINYLVKLGVKYDDVELLYHLEAIEVLTNLYFDERI